MLQWFDRYILLAIEKLRDENGASIDEAPQGKRKKGEPRTTWRRTAEKERDLMGWTSWSIVTELAADRTGWSHAVHSLMHPQGREEDK